MTRLRNLITLTVGLLFPLLAWGEGQTSAAADSDARLRDDYIKASLLVVEPSHEAYSLFGHCALRLECPSVQMDYCFTFETSTDTRGLIDFVQGTALGGFMAAQTDHYLAVYEEAGRSVTQYELNLTPTEKLRLWKTVDGELAKGFTRHYDYLHTHCTSMIVALVQQVSREPIIYNDLPVQLQGSFRDVLFTTSHYPWSTFFWQTVMGPAADATEPLEDKFVPVLLPEVWRRAGVIKSLTPDPSPKGEGSEVTSAGRSGSPLSPRRGVGGEVFGGEASPTLVFASLLLLVVGFTLGQLFRRWQRPACILDLFLLSVHLLVSIALLWLVTCSQLEGTQWNWYLLAFNPLPEVACLVTHRWDIVCRCTLWVLLAVLLLTPSIPQLDFPHALLIGTFAVRLAGRGYITQTKKINI